jgi:hypothetical protein
MGVFTVAKEVHKSFFYNMELSAGLAQPLATVKNMQAPANLSVGNTNFPVETQEMTNWCWAASASALSNSYNPTGQSMQRQIVADVLQIPACAGALSAACNQTADFADALNDVNHTQSPPSDSTLDSNILIAQLTANRPVGCQINVPGIGGHIVVVVAATQDASNNLFVTVADPSDGTLPVMTYDQLCTNYRGNGGQWVRSYLTQ